MYSLLTHVIKYSDSDKRYNMWSVTLTVNHFMPNKLLYLALINERNKLIILDKPSKK